MMILLYVTLTTCSNKILSSTCQIKGKQYETYVMDRMLWGFLK